ncbi:MAG: hypothetical protein JXR77_02075 [Lentisphaeria bacterium]|nr:hypothetical protein [Lentisphaeria bacterium]
MQDWVEQLLAVQEMDLRIDRLREQIASVPVEREKAEALLRTDEEEAVRMRAELQELEKGLKRIEIDADTIRTHKADFQTKSIMIKSNEEYRAALHQIELCDRQIQELEDRELELMERIEESRTSLREANRELEAARKRMAETVLDLDTRAKNCGLQMETLLGERTERLRGIDGDIAKRYERLRESRARQATSDRRALVPIRDGVCCDRCRMNVTAQTRMNARKSLLVTCENCGTLLYFESEPA